MTDYTQPSASWPAGPVPRPVSSAAQAAWRPAAAPLSRAQKLLLPLGALLFDWLFCLQGAGPNVFVFAVFVVAAQLVLLPKVAAVRRSGYFWLMVGGSLFSGGMMAVYGSGVAALACGASVLMLLGYVNQPHLRLGVYALLTAVGSGVQGGPRVLLGLSAPRYAGEGVRRGWFYGRLLLVPLLGLGGFHLLFMVANPRYLAYFARVMDALGEFLLWLLPEMTLVHVVFLTLGFLVTAGAVVLVPVYLYADHESRFGEFIRRQRDRVASFAVRRPNFQPNTRRALDLRKEWVAAVVLFALVNALLLVVNAIDVNWLWFGFVPKPGFDLTQFVHEGTYVLIFSILLAMGIVLWFFRRNLNFYVPGLPWLRWGATVWVVQNAVLAVSVGLRNYYYIQHSGLAYKRIGVCFFLLLVFFGLGTVLLKIWQRRSAYSLVRLNFLAVYAAVLLLAAGNWEVWIARYNLQARFRSIDIGFLLDMPGRVLPTLVARRALISTAPHLTAEAEHGGTESISAPEAQRRLDVAMAAWRSRYQARSNWQGRTYTDWRTAQALRAQ
ncbi:DUF4153 domain-containing protein [Hymenobacter glacialis]|uniref:DUF4153 domain-containing protein n=1 Tax=Hymenobacter glacialis TaxID=1908236 RepID=UPI000B092930|nr:DUF4173 domain-containing protein [Hymenobacter glacialis]